MQDIKPLVLPVVCSLHCAVGFGVNSATCRPSARDGGHNVILAWDASGDFGPQTPNTRTAGWQEAIDYCVEHGRDLYVKGGWGGRKAIYHVQDTIRIPATQDFRIDGGIYVLNWTGPPDRPDKDLMVIDSTMNGEYHFGIFVYGGAGAALRIRPERPVPIDGFPVLIETEIKSQGIADPHPFTPGERKAGTGLVLDGTKAPITCSRFDFIGGILNFRTCIDVSGQFSQNHFDCLHLHTNSHNGTLLRLGPECLQNVFRFAIGVDQGATGVRGLQIFGRNNTFEVMTRGGFPKANDVVLEGSARGNRLDMLHFGDRFDPLALITDRAAVPTNQITWVGGQICLRTIQAPAGRFVHTQRLYPATARVMSGTVTSLKLVRDGDELDYTATPSADISLGVGDQLVLETGAGVQIRIVPLKTR
jgi:hypothetical protein